MDNLTPVLIFAYNRLDHIQQTIDALSQNIVAEDTELYIFSDAPKNVTTQEAVIEVRTFLHTIVGFKSVTIIERNENYGLAKNIIEGVTDIINQYGKVIVLEDDLLTSKNFLCYMNAALQHYENQKHIFAISGYSAPLKSLNNYKFNTYLSYRPSSWGWATWKECWDGIDWDVTDFETFIKNGKKTDMFNRGGIDMTRMLKRYIQSKNNSWAIRWSYAMFKRNHYCIYPTISKVQNIGFGKDATHCSNTNIYETIIDHSSNCNFNFTNDIEPNDNIARDFRYQFSYTNKLIKKTIGYFKGTFS